MKKFTMLAGMALLATSGAVLAQGGDAPPLERGADVTRQQVIERTAQRFARLDLDRDGRVTIEEARQGRSAQRDQRAGRAFDRLDLNHDGNVTRAEFDQARAQLRGARGERRAGHGPRRGGRFMRRAHRAFAFRAGQMFGEQGFITREQFQDRALARFDRLDSDRNGTVTVAERRQALEQMRERRRQGGNETD